MMNQCDGCMQRAPTRNGLHLDKDGHAFMACQREKYLEQVICLSCGARAESSEAIPCGH